MLTSSRAKKSNESSPYQPIMQVKARTRSGSRSPSLNGDPVAVKNVTSKLKDFIENNKMVDFSSPVAPPRGVLSPKVNTKGLVQQALFNNMSKNLTNRLNTNGSTKENNFTPNTNPARKGFSDESEFSDQDLEISDIMDSATKNRLEKITNKRRKQKEIEDAKYELYKQRQNEDVDHENSYNLSDSESDPDYSQDGGNQIMRLTRTGIRHCNSIVADGDSDEEERMAVKAKRMRAKVQPAEDIEEWNEEEEEARVVQPKPKKPTGKQIALGKKTKQPISNDIDGVDASEFELIDEFESGGRIQLDAKQFLKENGADEDEDDERDEFSDDAMSIAKKSKTNNPKKKGPNANAPANKLFKSPVRPKAKGKRSPTNKALGDISKGSNKKGNRGGRKEMPNGTEKDEENLSSPDGPTDNGLSPPADASELGSMAVQNTVTRMRSQQSIRDAEHHREIMERRKQLEQEIIDEVASQGESNAGSEVHKRAIKTPVRYTDSLAKTKGRPRKKALSFSPPEPHDQSASSVVPDECDMNESVTPDSPPANKRKRNSSRDTNAALVKGPNRPAVAGKSTSKATKTNVGKQGRNRTVPAEYTNRSSVGDTGHDVTPCGLFNEREKEIVDVIPFAKMKLRGPSGLPMTVSDKVVWCKPFKSTCCQSGLCMLEPGEAKGWQKFTDGQVTVILADGQLELSSNSRTILLTKFDAFRVPAGTYYNIKNTSTNEKAAFFFNFETGRNASDRD